MNPIPDSEINIELLFFFMSMDSVEQSVGTNGGGFRKFLNMTHCKVLCKCTASISLIV